MRIFQTSGYYASYRPRLRRLAAKARTFREQLQIFFDDRYGASHLLLPIASRDPNAFFTNWDDEFLQRAWAREAGLPKRASLENILLAQIEEHRTEVFYNLDPVRLSNDFIARLPSCVKRSIAWRAAPSGSVDFSKHDLVVCNFPGILAGMARRGYRTAYFAPSHDPVMDRYAEVTDRSVDVLFVGGYSRHHARRAEILNAIAGLADQFQVVFHLDQSRLTRMAELPFATTILPRLAEHRRPELVRSLSGQPVFGLDLYGALARAKIVLNGAIDMVGEERGNMRCFEAMGCGALLLSDAGKYPAGMVPDQTMITYTSATDAIAQARRLLGDEPFRLGIAREGYKMVSRQYSKEVQWLRFQELV